ncbi:unnamed protein product [Peniophora sp. CBMAI 1063]|nr:unnamed protein product [Peniophora sp. CBMAI 1063]
MRSAEHLKAPEYEFRKADVVGGRVYLHEERLREGWEDNSAHVFYQLIQFCHGAWDSPSNPRLLLTITTAAITTSKQTPPPWKALSEDPSRLIAPECLLGSQRRFGVSPEKTHADTRNAFVRHWFRAVGYLEFHHYFARGGKFRQPESERWHDLDKYDEGMTQKWLSNEREQRGSRPGAATDEAHAARLKFGSKGPRITLPPNSPYVFPTALTNDAVRLLPDPDDRYSGVPTTYVPGAPSWPSPALIPNTTYARLQWATQILDETGGHAAITLLEALKWLAQLPPIANYEYDMNYFRPQAGKERTWVVEALPGWVSWKLDRTYLQSQTEIDDLSSFLRAQAWSFTHEGKRRFAGAQMAWTIGLAAVLYVRALRHSEEVCVRPPSRWALSGGAPWQRRARSYQYPLKAEELRTLLHSFKCYLEDLGLSMRPIGLPPSLLYCHHRSREDYVLALVDDIPDLKKLALLTFAMPLGEPESYPSLPCFVGRPVWQLPHLGIPRSAFRDQMELRLLEEAMQAPILFVREDGSPRSAEAGLTAVLELYMALSELKRLANETSEPPAYLRNWTADHFDEIKVLIPRALSAFARHSELLSRALRATAHEQDRPLPDQDTEAQAVLRDGDIEFDIALQRRDAEQDALQARLEAIARQEFAKREQRKVNADYRRDQNSVNLAVHHAVHPRKPPEPPLSIPELLDVHNELEYVPSDPPELPVVSGKPRRVVRTSAGRPRGLATQQTSYKALKAPLMRSTQAEVPAVYPASSKPKGQTGRTRRRQQEDEPRMPVKYRRVSDTASRTVPVQGGDLSASLDDEEDDVLFPLLISRNRDEPPSLPGEDPFLRAEREASRSVEEQRSLPAADDPNVSNDAAGTSFGTSGLAPSRPRARRKNNKTPSQPGISTAFSPS